MTKSTFLLYHLRLIHCPRPRSSVGFRQPPAFSSQCWYQSRKTIKLTFLTKKVTRMTVFIMPSDFKAEICCHLKRSEAPIFFNPVELQVRILHDRGVGVSAVIVVVRDVLTTSLSSESELAMTKLQDLFAQKITYWKVLLATYCIWSLNFEVNPRTWNQSEAVLF